MTDTRTDSAGRYARMAEYLAHDPDNLRLIADTAEAAFAEERFDEAQELLDRHARLVPLDPPAQHMAGLIAMRRLDWEGAAERYAALMDSGEDAPAIRFNRAWSLAMAKRFEEALPLIDDATSAEIPAAAQLEVGLLHQLGQFERAEERARILIELHPDHRGLNGAVSTLAMDIEDVDLARQTAAKAPDHPESMVTLGTLALGDDDPEAAAVLFDQVLARTPDAPRALIGRGLTRLLTGDPMTAAQEIDRGAGIWGDHLGSWIAAGWAYAIAGDMAAAKARFEKAVELDDSFGEAQGSMAVIEILEGNIDEAKRRTEIALRLDRQSFSGALAAMLLASGGGNQELAKRIFERAIHTPIDGKDMTIARSLARLGTRLG